VQFKLQATKNYTQCTKSSTYRCTKLYIWNF